MATGLLIPVGAGVSCSWQCHRARRPPSSEPGTDRASSYGTAVVAAGAGTIIDRKTTTTGATGRYVTLRLGDGRTVRYLHLARVDVALAQKVTRGQRLGTSGASGFGADWYYGPHVHTTLWPGAAWAAPTIDFEKHTGSSPSGGDMPLTDADVKKIWDYVPPSQTTLTTGRMIRSLFWSLLPGIDGVKTHGTVYKLIAAAAQPTPPITADQVKAIADQITAQLQIPAVEVDYEKIADAVNDDAARRLQD